MDNRPMTQWQKFALVIFAIVVIGAVVYVFFTQQAGFDRMI